MTNGDFDLVNGRPVGLVTVPTPFCPVWQVNDLFARYSERLRRLSDNTPVRRYHAVIAASYRSNGELRGCC